jgi:two-component system OmpR family response regulator
MAARSNYCRANSRFWNVRNEGQVVPRAMLLQHVWDLHFDPMTNIIDVYVGRVRRKVDTAQAYPLIHTIRGVGFCVRAPR